MILRDENMNKIENEMYELSEKVRENRRYQMLNFDIRESDPSNPNEPGTFVLTVSSDNNVIMSLHLWSGDLGRLQKTLQESGF
jgi:hypothetical protein